MSLLSFNSTKYTMRIESLESELEKSQEMYNAIHDECANYKRTIAAFPQVKADYDSKMESMKKEFNSKVSKLEKDNEIIRESVAKQVNVELASIGLSIDKCPKDDNSAIPIINPSETLETLKNLKGNERTNFYRDNEDTILHALNITKSK